MLEVDHLTDFSQSKQLPISVVSTVAGQFFGILNLNYPETIAKISIVKSPWLFTSLWSLLKPFIAKELLQKIKINGGGNAKKVCSYVTPVMPTSQIPAFLGGDFTENGDPLCPQKVGPAGPFMKDEGKKLLAR